MNAGQLHKLARLLREIAMTATSDADEERISAGDLAVIEDVSHHEGSSVGEIASRTGLAQSLVSTTVAQMREAGVLLTSPDPSDRRRSLVRLAPAARTQVFNVRAARSIDTALRRMRPESPPAELQRIDSLLDELGRHLLT